MCGVLLQVVVHLKLADPVNHGRHRTLLAFPTSCLIGYHFSEVFANLQQ